MKLSPITLRGRSLYRLMKVISGLSFCLYGYDAGVLGGLIMFPPFLKALGNPKGVYTIPLVVATYDLAAFFTALGITFFTFRIGRRGTILMGNAVAIIGAILQASTYSLAQMFVGRVFTGFAIGCISSSVPTYLNETGSKVTDRGPANAINAMFLIGGVPLAYWIDYGFIQWHSDAAWRIPIILQTIFSIISGGTMLFLPDTPRWYYARKRYEDGDKVLSQLYDEDINSESVQETRRQILAVIEMESEATEKLQWKMFLTGGIIDKTRMKIVRRICMCFWIPMFGEWIGVSFLSYFATVVLSTVTTPNLVPILAAVLTTVEAFGTVPLYWTIEKFGRRSILLGTACTSTLIYIALITCVAIGGTGPKWGAVGLLFVLLPVMTYGWQAIKFLYTSEIAPLEYRHIGTGAAAAGEWLMVFITVFVGPIGLQTSGWPFWFFFFAGNIVAIIFVFLLCPETGGKTLEQVDYLFMDKTFPGLQRNFDVDQEDAEKALGRRQQAEQDVVANEDEKSDTSLKENREA